LAFRAVDPRTPWQRLGWAVPWLLFQVFPLADLFTTPRPAWVRVVALAGLLVFTGAYLVVFGRLFGRRGSAWPWRALLVVAVLGISLSLWLGPSWAGLMIYVAAASSGGLPERWVWPAVGGSAAVCASVIAAHGMFPELFILPVICVLTGFALRGTRYLVSVNAELLEAREEQARAAVAEERLRFARDLHDLLGHSLSLIALKSELAGRLAERDPARARAEMADVETAARRALAEVREAVSGYRQIGVALALAEARAALSAAGITLRAPRSVPPLPGPVDAVLGWVVREGTTNVLRHSGARTVTVDVSVTGGRAALTVTDDGRGPAQPVRGACAGLSGLEERLAGLDGRLTAGAVPGGGFRLAAEVPVAARVGAP
jgi:two-component system, NarL family, sensor histidine kinase DesK